MTERDLDVKRLAFLPCSFFSSLKTKRKVHKRRRRGEREREKKEPGVIIRERHGKDAHALQQGYVLLVFVMAEKPHRRRRACIAYSK